MKNLNNTAFSLLEVLLAAVIFIISIGGIFATLNAVRTPVAHKEGSLSVAVFGKQVLEALRSQVSDQPSANYYSDSFCSGSSSSTICTDFSLAVGTHYVQTNGNNWPSGLSWPTALVTANTVPCYVTQALCLVYIVTCADGTYSNCSSLASSYPNMARRVDLNIINPS